MKIIFLDIDGVLNSVETAEIFPAAIQNLNHIIQVSNAELVISSFWNYLYPLDQINGKLAEAGVCKPAFAATREIGSNQDHSSVVTASAIGAKSQEIQLWLEKQTGITSFVIFDDDPIYISKAHEHHAVIVDPEKGLTKEDADHALLILSLPLPDKIPDFYVDWLNSRRNTSANPTK